MALDDAVYRVVGEGWSGVVTRELVCVSAAAGEKNAGTCDVARARALRRRGVDRL